MRLLKSLKKVLFISRLYIFNLKPIFTENGKGYISAQFTIQVFTNYILLLLLLLMAAHQALPSLGFSRQEHWSGLPFPSPMHESEVTQSCPTLSDPMDCSLPGCPWDLPNKSTRVGCHCLL